MNAFSEAVARFRATSLDQNEEQTCKKMALEEVSMDYFHQGMELLEEHDDADTEILIGQYHADLPNSNEAVKRFEASLCQIRTDALRKKQLAFIENELSPIWPKEAMGADHKNRPVWKLSIDNPKEFHSFEKYKKAKLKAEFKKDQRSHYAPIDRQPDREQKLMSVLSRMLSRCFSENRYPTLRTIESMKKIANNLPNFRCDFANSVDKLYSSTCFALVDCRSKQMPKKEKEELESKILNGRFFSRDISESAFYQDAVYDGRKTNGVHISAKRP